MQIPQLCTRQLLSSSQMDHCSLQAVVQQKQSTAATKTYYLHSSSIIISITYHS